MLKNDFVTLIKRLILLYGVLTLCRILFYVVNIGDIGAVPWGELWGIIEGSLIFDTVSILYANIPFIILSLLPLRLRERGWYQSVLFYLFAVVNSIVVVLNFADTIYFHYAKKRITSEEFHFASNNNNIQIALKSMLENWYMVLLAAGFIAGMIWCYKRIKYHPTKLSRWFTYYPVSLLTLALVAALTLVAIRGGFDRSTRPITMSNAMQYTSGANKSSMILSNPFCIIRTLGKKPFVARKYMSQEDVETLFSPVHTPANSLQSIGKRNIVIFTLESFSREHSVLLNPGLYDQGEAYMPFLDSLMLHSYTFADAFASGRKSIDAPASILASIPSYERPFILLPQAVSTINGLPKILAENGYTTSYFCGSQRNSMGFVAFAKSSGVDLFFTREDFESKKGTDHYDKFWGIWDEPFMQFMGETLTELKEPFFANITTLTSHHPYVIPEEYKDILPMGRTKAHRPIAYTDMAIRRFFDYAKQQSWYNNTIFVFVADHVSVETFAPKTATPLGNAHIIMAMYTPDGAIKGIDTLPAQQADIMPTLLGLIGNKRPYFAFGTDVMNEQSKKRIAVNCTGGTYQIMTDSIVLMFNPERESVESVFMRSDSLQINNIYNPEDLYQQQVLTELKARVQSYGQRVEERNFLP